ncbi:hypothetical protein [Micromonospora endolithica]|uniref:Uncharacterized protein n=1 Tax=Micromonospora endolithica TaxID=230091 RepID=A0A3A9Z0S0_9ACTN|nr:hypothetical protein [Micromonospora endolithica]RKN41006.1 hypothetical protein D7223_24955 [Micromonospora endolithica]TWJ24222.1 hypothetical protein JD76_04370 [Micromonospora endolithica]
MPTVVPPALIVLIPLLVGAVLLLTRARLGGLRHAYREMEAALRSALRLPPASGRVCAIRCPHCCRWVKPRRFDLRRMSCHSCIATLARPHRDGDLCL